MIRRPPRSTLDRSSAASDVYKRQELGIWLPRVHLECDFLKVARLDDLLQVSVYVGRFGSKSMKLNFEVRRLSDDALVATAHFILAAIKQDTFETVPIPTELRERLGPYNADEPP